jgi:hypothetical protein
MSDTPDEKPKDEIPAVKFSPKRVDDSWKEEVRREREAAKMAQPQGKPAAAARPAAPAAASPAAASSPAQAEGGKADEAAAPAEPAKPAGTPAEQQQSKIFMTFLAGMAQQALMQMGEIESPFSGQREVDLQGARYTIELLNTIQAKTKGNLTTEESESLNEAIHDLKMRYVELAREVQRQMQEQAMKAGPGGPGGARRAGPGGTIPGPGFGKR